MTTTRASRRHVSRVFGPHRRWATGIAILGVGLAGSALLLATGPQATPVEHEEKAWPVSTQVVEHRTLAPRFVTWARFEASQVARLRAAVDAPVQSVHVRAGDRVAAGDVLVRLEATDFELAVVQAAADVAAAEADLASFEVGGRRLAAEAAHQLRLSDIAAARLARHERLLADGTVCRPAFNMPAPGSARPVPTSIAALFAPRSTARCWPSTPRPGITAGARPW